MDGEARIHGPGGSTAVNRVPVLRFTFGSELDVRTITTAAYEQPPKTNVPFASHAFHPGVHWSTFSGRIALADGVEYGIRILDSAGRQTARLQRAIRSRAPAVRIGPLLDRSPVPG